MEQDKTTVQPQPPVAELVPREGLRLADYNPRKITGETLDRLCASLTRYGFIQPVVARREDGLVVGGHQRLAAYDELVRRGTAPYPVPVVYMDGLDDAEAKRLNLALNRIQGTWDYDKLADLFGELTVADVEAADVLGYGGFDLREVQDITGVGSAEALGVVERAQLLVGELEPLQVVAVGERVVTFKLPEADAAWVEGILRRFGADDYKKRASALVVALREAERAATERLTTTTPRAPAAAVPAARPAAKAAGKGKKGNGSTHRH